MAYYRRRYRRRYRRYRRRSYGGYRRRRGYSLIRARSRRSAWKKVPRYENKHEKYIIRSCTKKGWRYKSFAQFARAMSYANKLFNHANYQRVRVIKSAAAFVNKNPQAPVEAPKRPKKDFVVSNVPDSVKSAFGGSETVQVAGPSVAVAAGSSSAQSRPLLSGFMDLTRDEPVFEEQQGSNKRTSVYVPMDDGPI